MSCPLKQLIMMVCDAYSHRQFPKFVNWHISLWRLALMVESKWKSVPTPNSWSNQKISPYNINTFSNRKAMGKNNTEVLANPWGNPYPNPIEFIFFTTWKNPNSSIDVLKLCLCSSIYHAIRINKNKTIQFIVWNFSLFTNISSVFKKYLNQLFMTTRIIIICRSHFRPGIYKENNKEIILLKKKKSSNSFENWVSSWLK